MPRYAKPLTSADIGIGQELRISLRGAWIQTLVPSVIELASYLIVEGHSLSLQAGHSVCVSQSMLESTWHGIQHTVGINQMELSMFASSSPFVPIIAL